MVLSLAEQTKLAKKIPKKDLEKLAGMMIQQGQGMHGSGFMSFIKKIGNKISPIVSAIGPTVLEKIIKPFVLKKLGGGGLRLAGQRGPMGKGFKVSGGAKHTSKPKAKPRGKGPLKRKMLGSFTLA
jgi:hypothetical protein